MQSAADPTTLDLMAQVIEGFATEHDELSAALRPSWAQVPPHLWVDRTRASFELHAVAAAVRAAAAAYREADLGVRRSLNALAELASGAGLLTEGTRMPGLVDLAPSGRAPTSVGEALAAVSDLGAQQDGRVRVVGVPMLPQQPQRAGDLGLRARGGVGGPRSGPAGRSLAGRDPRHGPGGRSELCRWSRRDSRRDSRVAGRWFHPGADRPRAVSRARR